ncbi:MAG: glycosyltransferase [Paludibacter sp.]
MKVDVYVLCYNEIKLVPFALDYWAKFATNVYILDNGSVDGTLELLKSETRFNIEIIPFESNNELNDAIYLELKNNSWKKSIGKCDFVVVSDFDEMIYSDDINRELQFMKDNNQTICFPRIYEMVNEVFPTHNGLLLHEIVDGGIKNQEFGKRVLFNPNKIQEINYTAGCHSCNPVGEVNYYTGNQIFMFHFKYLSLDYILKRHEEYNKRLSELNKKNGWGKHYSDKNKRKVIDVFKMLMKKKVNINEGLKKGTL